MLTMCPAAALASSRARAASADAAPGNVPRDPARDAKPSGKLRCKNAGTNVHAGLGIVRSIPVVRIAASKNLHSLMLGAGPRPANPRQLTPFAARAAAADTAAPGRAVAHVQNRWLDNADSPADAASAEPLADNLRCNNVLADAAARTAVRIP
jgi:hypothetical protein